MSEEWALTEEAQARAREELARIERAQSQMLTCRACGQRVANPIGGGFCHKITPEHDRLKAEIWRT